ncbi:MAG: chromate efflux transporter [Oceanibaculum nanhaiense]|uniref:chromate efflux transporter n=1 Tax=Oceanibaculum nanhaiense TaxID=1909734 RepID=UPI0025A498CA|nr:chromate efflux transporter [Oceanibaculum nanhaiense]MDM7947492.1 chromate efflux transporter [Oceanibaculum nanhaiense]
MSSIPRHSVLDIFLIFLRLGCTSFGGPVAHIGYFREEFVARRRWLDEQAYADLVALGQFLPGPASSQVGFAIGTLLGGRLGGIAAWIAFTLPSALLMALFAAGVMALGETRADWQQGALKGLKLVALAVVAQAVWGMARSLCPDRERATLAVAAALIVVLGAGEGAGAVAQIAAILLGAIVGAVLLKPAGGNGVSPVVAPYGRGFGWLCLVLFFVLLIGLPLADPIIDTLWFSAFDSFFRIGALVFGGGHVVLPLLQAEVVGPGWVGREIFIAGYGAAQAMPGPLFTIASYLGMMMGGSVVAGLCGAVLVTLAIFLPAGLLMWGALPFWSSLRAHPKAQSVLMGVNAAVVGLLLAALYDPVFTTAVAGPPDLAAALVCFAALQFWKAPPWAVVVLAGLVGAALYSL